jgi:diketogulonate reductase-like aldo/keto reductase
MATLTLAETQLARIGLGTNRLRNTPEHVAFVRAAVAAGIGLIDTAHMSTKPMAQTITSGSRMNTQAKVDVASGVIGRPACWSRPTSS